MKKHLTLTEACAFAHVSRWTMRRWIARGLVHAVGGNDKSKSSPIRIDAASLLSMMVTK